MGARPPRVPAFLVVWLLNVLAGMYAGEELLFQEQLLHINLLPVGNLGAGRVSPACEEVVRIF
jgi:hypothetical protein